MLFRSFHGKTGVCAESKRNLAVILCLGIRDVCFDVSYSVVELLLSLDLQLY